ncbi:MAG: hemerythrin domain-containing protein [Candidatus Zixiibacteriota bacterium]
MNRLPEHRKTLIQMLVEEHQHITASLSTLESMRKCLAGRHLVPSGYLETIVRFFSEYGDKIHHHSEEELLFPAVERTANRQLKRMQERLGIQHLLGRLFVCEMKHALKDARAERRGWRRRFIDNAKAFQTLLAIHICDENHLYFPLAERVLIRKDGLAEYMCVQPATHKTLWEKRVDRLFRKYCPDQSNKCDFVSASACHDCGGRE